MAEELVVDYDPSVWLEPDLEGDLDDWALTAARTCFEEAGLAPDDRSVTALSAALLTLSEYAREVPGMAFIHLREPEYGPRALAVLTVTDAGDGTEASLRSLVGADDADLIEPAVVSDFNTPLGRALRARRYLRSRDDRDPPGTVLAAVTYAWHVPMVDADVRLTASSFDLADLAAVEADMDSLARAVTIDLG